MKKKKKKKTFILDNCNLPASVILSSSWYKLLPSQKVKYLARLVQAKSNVSSLADGSLNTCRRTDKGLDSSNELREADNFVLAMLTYANLNYLPQFQLAGVKNWSHKPLISQSQNIC